MDEFLRHVAFFMVCLVIGIVYKKILEFQDEKRWMFHEDNQVYYAASKFSNGASFDEVKNILVSCFDFSKKSADVIWECASPHKTDRDGGYRFFIRSVNKELGDSIYNEKHHIS